MKQQEYFVIFFTLILVYGGGCCLLKSSYDSDRFKCFRNRGTCFLLKPYWICLGENWIRL